MRKKLSRTEYKEKFDHLMEEYNYIPQDGEVIVQCHAPYPAWWFISNMGYLLSCHKNRITVIKANYRKTGKKNSDGSRNGQDWYYEYRVKGEKHNRHIVMHKLIAEHFLINEFETLEDVEVHHIRPKNTFRENEPQFCNRVSNLQVLPKSVHKDLTHKYGKTIEQLDKESEERAKKAGVESVQMTNEELMRILITGMITNEGTPIVYLSKQADDPKDIECKAHTIKAVVLQE